MKLLLYMFQCLSEDEESQKRGIVMISFPCINFDPSTISKPKAKKLIFEVLQSIGIRIAANHICFPDKPWFRALGAMYMMASTRDVRVRTRMHYGKHFPNVVRGLNPLAQKMLTHYFIPFFSQTPFLLGSITESQYKIMTFGIPSDQVPIKNSGTIKLQNHKKWIAFRQMKDRGLEEQGEYFDGATFCPSPNDVLAIGGMHFYKFPGNCRYRELLESNLKRYDNAGSVSEKIKITNEVLMTVEASGGRFLVRDKKGWWAPANEHTARIKVSNAFRDVRKSIRAQANRKRLKSDTHKFASVSIGTKFVS